MEKVYYDMDGVLADFEGQPNALERFITEAGFFQKLKPTRLAQRLNDLLAYDNNEVYILSASPNERADIDKVLWLFEHMPNLKRENINIVKSGKGAKKRKAKYAKESSVLVDDYTTNLLEWESKGGKGIKCLNGRNGKGGKWKGEVIKFADIY